MSRPGHKTLLSLAAIALTLATTAACRHSQFDLEDTFRMNIDTEPPTLDWALATDSTSIKVLWNIMDGLTRFDDNLRPIPALAESWTVSGDGMTYTFHIKRGVKWSDGVELKASHFVDGWKRVLDPFTAAEYAYFLYDVHNAKAFNEGTIKDFAEVGVKATDDYTIEVRLDKPIVFFPAITTFMITYPARLDVIEKHGDRWTEPENIVTLGAYRLASWRHEYKIVLERYEDYHAEKAKTKRVVMYMAQESNAALDLYEAGTLDYVAVPTFAIPFFRDRPDYRSLALINGYYYGYNVTKPPFDNPKVRQAFSAAIDRTQMPKILNGSVVDATSWIPPGLIGHNPNLGVKFDPARAKALLAEAGYDSPSKLPPITLAYNTNDTHKLVADNVKEQWKKNLGVEVKLDNMEWKVYLEKLKNDTPQIFRLGWYADYPDPDNFMALFTSSSGNNHTNWASAEFDRIVGLAAAEPDLVRRKELYDQAQRLLIETDCAIAPLFNASLTKLISPRIDGLRLNAMDILELRNVVIKNGKAAPR